MKHSPFGGRRNPVRRHALRVNALLAWSLLSATAQDASSEMPDLHPTVSWLGNTFSGQPFPQYVPLKIEDISVSGDGTVATNGDYNEVATSVVTFRDGGYLCQTGHQVGGPRNRSVVAEDPDGQYLFFSVEGHSMGTGAGRVLPSGAWDPRGLTKEAAHNWPDKRLTGRIITGLAVRDGRIYASDSTPGPGFNGIRVFDKTSLQLLQSIPLARAGKLAITREGDIWVVLGWGESRDMRLVKLSGQDGRLLAWVESIRSIGGIAVDQRDRLLVADQGPDHDIKILSSEGAVLGAFGVQGGVFAGPVPGVAGPARLERPRGVGVDSLNNLYVLSAGACWPALNRIECYAPSGDSWGPRKWEIVGMMFGDVATFDPGQDDLLHTSHAVIRMDWSAPPGHEWSCVASTLDGYRFPDDPRCNIFSQGFAGRTTFGVRYIQGRKFLFSGLDNVEILRFDAAHGEVGIPSGYVCLRDLRIDKAEAHWPSHPPKYASWIWRDAHGAGTFDGGAYEPLDNGRGRPNGIAAVDLHGNLWWFPVRKLGPAYCLPVAPALDDQGNLVYHASDLRQLAMPPGYLTYGLSRLDETSGDLYVIGKRHKLDEYELARFPHWREDPQGAKPAWTLSHLGKSLRPEVSQPSDTDIGSLVVEGAYVFIASAMNNAVRVYRKSDGSPVGWMRSDLSLHTTMDNTNGFQVHRRANGEYVLILMDYLHNKNLVYRWMPSA